MKGIRSVSTKNMSREDWLALRRHTIGGSDAAAIIGLNAWASPYSVWADKTGRLPDKPDNEAMRQGRDLEDYVARRWMEESGKKVNRVNRMLYNDLYPYAHADIDRAVLGEYAGLECKTTSSLDVKQFKGGEFPEKYYAQCVHYLAVTGWDRWYLAVLVLGRGFYTFVLERDQDEIDALMAAEGGFWQHVKEDTPPSPDGTEATGDALQTIYSESRNEGRDLFGRESLLDEYMMIKRQSKALELRISEIENLIKEDMQEAERGTCGAYTVSWKSQQRQNFQSKEFAKAFPDVNLAPFYKTSTARPFKVSVSASDN
ncbi:MAG: YqaJ viral recombinase family protein [Clostridiaceae bacterium]|nr:YqaJ viral recombinase family protein [Clostridiaceae bacterium]